MSSSKRVKILTAQSTYLVAASILVGCTSSQIHEQWADGRPARASGVTEFRPLSETTLDHLKLDFADEPSGGAPLAIGLSLSGGGPRAAMFAHGVMQGLNDNLILDKIDAISSVSGGSYAALWYYTKRLETLKAGIKDHNVIFTDCIPLWWQSESIPGSKNEETETAIRSLLLQAGKGNDGFKEMYQCKQKMHFTFGDAATGLKYKRDPFRWQTHIGRWPDLFQTSETIATGNRQGAPWWQIAQYAVVMLGEWIKAPFVDTSSVATGYQYGIERAWALNPNPRTSWNESFSYTNDIGQIHTRNWHLDPDTATWKLLRDLHSNKSAAKMPLWIMNTSTSERAKGSKDDALYRDQSEIFEITPFGQGSGLTGYLRGNSHIIRELGTSVRVSGAALDSTKWYYPPAIKLGETLKNPYQANPKEIRLSDGGHSENLGIYSLLRRGTRDVIIVDAEEDIEGRMQGICVARQMLKNEGAQLNFDKSLINLDQVCSDWNSRKGQKLHAYSTSAWVNGVVPGEVIWPKKNGIPNSHIWLIKLGWDEKAVGRAFAAGKCETKEYPISCMLAAYYGSNVVSTIRADGKMYFPQLSTPGAAYSSSTYLFWAYRELGRSAASLLQVDESGALRLKAGTVVKNQQLLCAKEKLSAVPCAE